MKKKPNGSGPRIIEPGLQKARYVDTPVILTDRDQHLTVTVDLAMGKIVNIQEAMPPRINYTRPIMGVKAQEAEMRRAEWELLEHPEAMEHLVVETDDASNN